MPLFTSLYGYARWLTKEPNEAEDLVQETYLKALRGFASFRQGTNFRAWMFRILRNTFLTSRSGLKEVAGMDDDVVDAIADRSTPETILISRTSGDALRRAIEQLPLIFREVLLLSDVESMTYKEISQTLGIPVGTVTSRLMRARERLRRTLGGIR